MSVDRRMRLWSLVVEHARGGPVGVEHVCAAVLSAAGVDSVAVAVALSASPRETMYASDRVAAEVEELTLTLGEGPGVDAFTGGPALVAELTASDCLARWPVFAPAATLVGVRAPTRSPCCAAAPAAITGACPTSPGPSSREPSRSHRPRHWARPAPRGLSPVKCPEQA